MKVFHKIPVFFEGWLPLDTCKFSMKFIDIKKSATYHVTSDGYLKLSRLRLFGSALIKNTGLENNIVGNQVLTLFFIKLSFPLSLYLSVFVSVSVIVFW